MFSCCRNFVSFVATLTHFAAAFTCCCAPDFVHESISFALITTLILRTHCSKTGTRTDQTLTSLNFSVTLCFILVFKIKVFSVFHTIISSNCIVFFIFLHLIIRTIFTVIFFIICMTRGQIIQHLCRTFFIMIDR